MYCRAKGHLRADCFKLKRKQERVQQLETSGPAVAVSAVQSNSKQQSTIAFVHPNDGRTLNIESNVLNIIKINGKPCKLTAMLDTGSPISFIQPRVFQRFFDIPLNKLKPIKLSYSALNNTPISLFGSWTTSIRLELLSDLDADIILHVFCENAVSTDIVIERDFLSERKISILYNPAQRQNVLEKQNEASKSLLFSQLTHLEDRTCCVNTLENNLQNLLVDFDSQVKENLVKMILEVEKTEIKQSDDDYYVTVNLKDTSTYAFAPRRFAWAERKQIREITDDLLSRGIIKFSTSPYCARVVPVRKRNGSMRLCVDLRPLNSKVVKQKYPFPLIEDALTRLSDKVVFTLLDMKDGFHQIKIHPNHSKYFSFATPDGHFEYVRLPFGYCESPAEFQKRLVQILQPWIR